MGFWDYVTDTGKTGLLYDASKIVASPVLVPLQGLYAAGGVLNVATGGKTTSWDIHDALSGNLNVVSPVVRVAGAPAAIVYDPSRRELVAVVERVRDAIPSLGDVKKWILWGGAAVAGVLLFSR